MQRTLQQPVVLPLASSEPPASNSPSDALVFLGLTPALSPRESSVAPLPRLPHITHSPTCTSVCVCVCVCVFPDLRSGTGRTSKTWHDKEH